jgi:hypothetical protein
MEGRRMSNQLNDPMQAQLNALQRQVKVNRWLWIGAMVLAFTGGAFADTLQEVFTGSAVPASIPYEGYLEEGGQPMDEPRELTFTLVSNGADVWTKTIDNVPVSNGRFAVTLTGEDDDGEALEDDALGGYLTLRIASGDVPIGEQVIQAVPFAGKAAMATKVDGESVLVSGSVEAATAVIHGTLNAGATVIDGTIQAESGFGYVPIGTILPWHKSINDDLVLPDGWLECNGEVIIDPDSSLNGQVLPDLNVQQLFLSGSDSSGVIEEESFPTLEYHSRNMGSGGTYTQDPLQAKTDGSEQETWAYGGSNASAAEWIGLQMRWVRAFDSDGAREQGYLPVRPKSMTVVYIMRIK